MTPKRILVVDDEESTAFFLAENLAELGKSYQIETASSGEEALRRVAARPFDLIISDLRMPGMDGLELLRRVKAQYPQTRLVLMTAYGSPAAAQQAAQLDVYGYITKPFRVEELIDAARAALQDKEPQRRGGLLLTSDQYAALTRRLDALRVEVGARCVLLADLQGQIVAQAGVTANLDAGAIARLAGQGYATTFELARRLGQESALNLTYQEGARHHVYSCNVGQTLVIVILFDKDSTCSRIGAVWLYARRAVQELAALTTPVGRETPAEQPASPPASDLRPAFTQGAKAFWSPTDLWEPPAPLAATSAAENTFSLEEAVRRGLIDPHALECVEG